MAVIIRQMAAKKKSPRDRRVTLRLTEHEYEFLLKRVPDGMKLAEFARQQLNLSYFDEGAYSNLNEICRMASEIGTRARRVRNRFAAQIPYPTQ